MARRKNIPVSIRRRTTKKGRGLLNTLINKLPVELHIPGYRFCGPGTKLQKRLDRDTNTRNIADRELAAAASNRLKASDSKLGEKIAAFGVSNIMNMKSKLGMRFKKLRKSKKKGDSLKRKRKITWGVHDKHKVEIPEGSYDIDAIIEYIQNVVGTEDPGAVVKITTNIHTSKIIIKTDQRINFDVEDSLGPLLGFDKKELPAIGTYVSDRRVELLKGFKIEKDRFVGKQFADYDGEKISHYIFKPPFPFNILPPELQQQAKWLSENHHALDWYSGYTPLHLFNKIIENLTREVKDVYVKGSKKAKYIRYFIPQPVTEMDEHPRLCKSTPKCFYHNKNVCFTQRLHTFTNMYTSSKRTTPRRGIMSLKRSLLDDSKTDDESFDVTVAAARNTQRANASLNESFAILNGTFSEISASWIQWQQQSRRGAHEMAKKKKRGGQTTKKKPGAPWQQKPAQIFNRSSRQPPRPEVVLKKTELPQLAEIYTNITHEVDEQHRQLRKDSDDWFAEFRGCLINKCAEFTINMEAKHELLISNIDLVREHQRQLNKIMEGLAKDLDQLDENAVMYSRFADHFPQTVRMFTSVANESSVGEVITQETDLV
ncbi:hypothetical protein NQ314_018133 [Rhamnusium bicolor]|uniref:Uncharacterized protein n=1 Tax=Rhamnusium bicolor TaxID=1586634 RepID=A0AAV8WTY4_9CUCU|nr:hypothetical protein NQ314_018133 [Rhamnusium bicolor]